MRRKEARDGGRKADPNPRGGTGQGSGAARAAAGDAAGAAGTQATPGGGASKMSVAIPDYVEPFEGWRVWRASSDGSQLRLRSVVQETVWPLREEFAAECLRRRILARLRGRQRHEAPADACACGIYATSLDRLGSYLHERGGTHYVFGR